MKHWNIIVSGRVQGVSFRYYTQLKANELGIKGYVMNMPEGTVYIEAEGSETQLNSLLKWCGDGPVLAKVTDTRVEESEVTGFSDFEIRR